jgi:predicted TIM-barrel fold metal-dependent hydrolase
MSELGKIDTHQHIVPPSWARYLDDHGYFGGQRTPPWSVEAAIAAMDEMRIATGVLSVSRPGVHFGDDAAARSMAREVNSYTAEVVRDRPDRFGCLATLPIPDVDGSLAECAYAFDVLNADGVILLTNHHGRYLGDPGLDPVMAELNERSAVVLVHPTAPPGLAPMEGIPPFVSDFLLDTTRAAMNIVGNGIVRRFPKLRIILSHAGGMVPYVAGRLAQLIPGLSDRAAFENDLASFYFDTALSTYGPTLAALDAFAAPERVIFGSDWPYAPGTASQHFTEVFDTLSLPEGRRNLIERGNALALFPRLAATRATR